MTERTDIEQLSMNQALSGAVNHNIHNVIQAAVHTVQLLKPQPGTDSGMRESQLRNVVNVSLEAQSVTEVAAFILYQMGRSTNSRQWLYGDFGTAVVTDLTAANTDAVVAAARRASQEAETALAKNEIVLTGAEKASLLATAHIALARQYLGYLNRLFSFADKTKGWERLTALVEVNDD